MRDNNSRDKQKRRRICHERTIDRRSVLMNRCVSEQIRSRPLAAFDIHRLRVDVLITDRLWQRYRW